MKALRLAALGVTAAAATLAGCASYDYGPTYPASYPAQSSYGQPYGQPYGAYNNAPANYVEFGRVTNVSLVSGTAPNRANNTAGTLLGAVVGGALGNQVGHGGGRAAATILGAVGGAAVGNSVTSRQGQPYAGAVYRVTVQTDQGQMRSFDVQATGDLRPGDRVRIENGAIYLA